MKVWLGTGAAGAIVDAVDAHVSVFNHGYTVAEGVFETMKTLDGRVFLLPWHLERLRQSAAVIGLPLPGDDLLTTALRSVVAANASTVPGIGRLRLTVTCSNDDAHVDGGAGTTVVATVMSAKQPTATAQLSTSPWPRNERSPLVLAKSTSYAENVLALQHAQTTGATEGLFFNTHGSLSEGTASNIFVVRDGMVLTPPVSDGLLPGVTRRFVMALGSTDIPVEERTISRALLDSADEVFLTSTFRDIQPVDRIDDRAFGVGAVTSELRSRFTAAAEADWCWVWGGP